MSKSLLFDSLHQWKVCFLSGCKNFAWGLGRIITCIFFGLLSLIRAAWHAVVKLVGKYPNVALGAAIVIGVMIWVLTFVSMRVRAVGAEAQRDSISYEYSQFKSDHGYE